MVRIVLALLLVGLAVAPLRAEGPVPVPVPAVIVTLFEIGEATGDVPGELQLWFEREGPWEDVTFPGGPRRLYRRADGVLLAELGVGNTLAAARVAALGWNPAYDLRRALWLVAGISGGDPDDTSLGSAVWARFVVDGDLAHEIDGREMPPDWPSGYIALGARLPNQRPPEDYGSPVVHPLDPELVDWAFALTRDLALGDSEAMAGFRSRFHAHPAALRAPSVSVGDSVSGSTYWHGILLNRWANDWVRLHTAGAGEFVTSAMEDAGVLQALTLLAEAGRVDRSRALVLRTVSNYTHQPPGVSVLASLKGEQPGYENQFPGFLPSLEAAHRAGSTVLEAWLAREQEQAAP